MIEPKEIEIDGKRYTISKFPAVAGREIVAKYPLSGMPKLGDYAVNQETMLKLMCYVSVTLPDGSLLPLSNRTLVDNHVKSWEVLAKIEIATMEYNCSFFQNGRVSRFFDDIAQKLPTWISKMLMGLSERLSQVEKPPSTN
jgi:hypothetical protein